MAPTIPTGSDGTLGHIATAKIPEFWKENPRLWFAQFKSVMKPQKQGNAAKYHLVIATLGREPLQQVGDLILMPPEGNKYDIIKGRLIKTYEESAEKQFQQLVSEMSLGSQKPTQLLRKMSDLAANTQVSPEDFKRLWISRLPNSLKAVLSVAQDTKLDELAALADKIMENLQSADIAAVASTAAVPAAPADLLAQITAMTIEMQNLSRELNEVRGRSFNRGNRWNRSRSQSRKPKRTRSSPDWLCRYHYRYRHRARTCEQPCNWVKVETSPGQRENRRNEEN